ncbi:MAG: ATP-binding protein [Sphingobacteriales bacterium]|nr:MAG: ATP-binding protein [Sphingobacteriales bacterium]
MKEIETIKVLIANYHKSIKKVFVSRDYVLPLTLNKIITVIGPRRSGKTALLQFAAQKLVKDGVKATQIIYINFEDERLLLLAKDLDKILQAYSEMYPNQELADCYFFFDEIQNVDGWEKFVRRVYDTVSSHVFLTGSNAKLLSSEIATELRGRTYTIELLPLSFKEYLRFKKIDTQWLDTKTQAKINAAFLQFMKEGGFPEIALLPSEFHKNILQDYYHVMMYRDMIERYGFSQVGVLKYFLKRMFECITTPFSVNKVFNELKSQGYKISKNTLYEYLDAAIAIFFCSTSTKFSHSILKQELSEKKYYAIDNGLLNALTFAFKDDWGAMLENTVHLEFRKKGLKTFFYKGNKECDFVLEQTDGSLLPVQVCYDLENPDTRKREFAGLTEACKYLNVKNGVVLTLSAAEDVVVEDINIQVIHVARYFL